MFHYALSLRLFIFFSPVSVHSSIIEFEANLEQVKCRLTKDLPTRMSTDWIWDWSSRPECVPVG